MSLDHQYFDLAVRIQIKNSFEPTSLGYHLQTVESNFKIRDLTESRSASDIVNANAIERFRDWITMDAEIHIGEWWFLSKSNCSKLTDAKRTSM